MSKLGQPADPANTHLGGWVNHGYMGKKVGETGTYCPTVWDFLLEAYHPQRYVDIGCGVGASLAYMKAKGLAVTGVEGDPAAIAEADPSIVAVIRRHDYQQGAAFEKMLWPFPTFDLCYSGEFVEHVDEQYMPNFMADIRRCKRALITYSPSAAGGHHHVNCRPADYWLGVFAANGFHYEAEQTQKIRNIALELTTGKTCEPCCWFGYRTFLFFNNLRKEPGA